MKDSAPRSSEGHRSFDTGTCYGLKDEPTFTKQGVYEAGRPSIAREWLHSLTEIA